MTTHFYSKLNASYRQFVQPHKYTIISSLLFFSVSLVQARANTIPKFKLISNIRIDSLEVKELLSKSIQFSYTDYEKAFSMADQALKLSKETKYEVGEIKSNYQIGSIVILQGQSDIAKAHFEEGLKKSQKIDKQDLIAKGYFHLSRYYLEISDYLNSLDYINRALDIFVKQGNKIEISRCYSSMANIYKDLSNYEQSLVYNFKSLKIKEGLHDKRGISLVLGNIGNIYLLTDKYEDARKNFLKSLELDKEINDTEGIVYSLTRLGVVHQKMGELDKALSYYETALALARKSKLRIDESVLIGNIGSTLREQFNYKESLVYLFKALELKKELNQLGRTAHTCNDISETYLKIGKITEAKKYALLAIDFAHNVNLNQEKYAYLILSKCDYLLGDYKNSYDHLTISNTLKDSIFSIDKAANMNELEIKYQNEKKEKEISLLTADMKSAEFKRNNYIIVGMLSFFILFFLYNSQRLKSIKRRHLLEKKNEVDLMKTRFFTNISHEFRTPLTLIISPIDELIEQIDVKKRLKVIKQNGQRLLNLVNQILDISKIESGNVSLETSNSDIIKVIKGIAMSFHSMAESKKIKLKLDITPDELKINFDKKKIETIIVNLVSNAIKFTPDNERIKIRTKLVKKTIEKKRREFISIKISDNGIGIPKKDINHIFNRFYQSETNQLQQHEGTGIGLAILKELVELHQGYVIAKSKVKKGTQIIIGIPTDLPITNPKHASRPLSTIQPQNQIEIDDDIFIFEEAEKIASQKPVILIIEDHKDVSNYIIEILESKYDIVSAKDGKQGTIKAIDLIPDLIISDVMIPKKNGYQVCNELKNDERTSHIPIILLTAKSSSENKIEGLLRKADDYITKPFNPKELLIRIKNLIESRKKLKIRYKKEGVLKPKEIAVNSIDEKFINRLISLVERHMSNEKFGVILLSKQMGISRSQLHRKLIILLGHGPNRFIRNFRLQRAHRLLEQKTASPSEVSHQVGFGSPSYFTKCFHKHYGYTPSSIQNQDIKN